MAQAARTDYLQPGETVLLQRRRDPRSLLDALLGVTLFAAAALTAVLLVAANVPAFPRWATRTAYLAIPALWLWAVAVGVLRLRTTSYVITQERVYASYGRVRFNLLQTTFDKVTDLHLRQSLFGRAFGFGTVRLHTAGASLALAGVRDPVAMKQQVEAARAQFLQRLVQDHRKRAKAAAQDEAAAAPARQAAAAPAPGAAPAGAGAGEVWVGRPAPASLAGRLVAASVFFLVGLVATAAGAARPAAFPFGIPMLLLGAIMGTGAFIHYRTTSYTVTSRGVVVQTGWLGRRRAETTYNKVTDVTTTQSLFGRAFGYGTISINTAGGLQAPVVFTGVHEPERVKAVIDWARQGGGR